MMANEVTGDKGFLTIGGQSGKAASPPIQT